MEGFSKPCWLRPQRTLCSSTTSMLAHPSLSGSRLKTSRPKAQPGWDGQQESALVQHLYRSRGAQVGQDWPALQSQRNHKSCHPGCWLAPRWTVGGDVFWDTSDTCRSLGHAIESLAPTTELRPILRVSSLPFQSCRLETRRDLQLSPGPDSWVEHVTGTLNPEATGPLQCLSERFFLRPSAYITFHCLSRPKPAPASLVQLRPPRPSVLPSHPFPTVTALL